MLKGIGVYVVDYLLAENVQQLTSHVLGKIGKDFSKDLTRDLRDASGPSADPSSVH